MLDMTDQELNRAIGELMGYSMKNTNTTKVYYRLVDPTGQLIGKSCAYESGVWSLYGPKYCTDPAASLEVQTKAVESDRVAYVNNLYEACYEFKRDKDSVWDEINIAFLLNASPRQSAEAAYMTLSIRE
ncbi:hypothetical protein JOD82_002058 [Paenibacillus sp. 1182]|uniref:hypothetical protein n=1 Tax=Paenibacillus sp. 1182 TaxID=2806565 RepID=UPI001AE5D53C|nr:hypothetical protein [Paenibacillus sp. 1182]MBP1309038.1 hypothetical protein [Paenibacillus sp. 1182]